jgi:ubiquinol-cytochrome c reductase cytochrome c subunit
VRKLAFALLLFVLVLPTPAAADPPRGGIVHVPTTPGETAVEHGYQLYAGNCSTCHGSGGIGIAHKRSIPGASDQLGLGPPLVGVGALAADFYLRTGYMPLAQAQAQPRRSRVLFGERELHDLIAYIASLGPGPAIPTPHPERGNLADGLKLFTHHCAGCHQIDAEGGYVTGALVPPLTDATPVQIAEAMRIGPYLMPRFSNKQLSDADVDSLIRYVEHTKHPTDSGGWPIGHVGPVPEGLVTWFIAMVAIVAACVVLGERNRS